VDFLL
jgi:hypothetical protein